MATLIQDLKYAARTLAKSPGFALVAVLTLALGIGANTAIFSLINAVLFKPLSGVEHAEQLVEFVRVQPNFRFTDWNYPDYLDYRDRNHTLAGLAARSWTPVNLAAGVTERVRGEMVSGNYFNVLGSRIALGRPILPADDGAPGANPVAVLNYDLWQRDFGADPQAIGRKIMLNGQPFIIVGIAAEGFAGSTVGAVSDLWVPISMQPQISPHLSAGILQNRTAGWIGLVGRLKPGVGLQQAQVDMATIASQLAQEYPADKSRTVALSPRAGIDPDEEANLRGFLLLLFAAVGLLLLIAASNVANLLLVRATSRQREIAVRLAIGATRARMVRQLLTEGLLLSFLAGAVGLTITPWVGDLTLAFRRNSYLMRSLDLSPDWSVLVFTLLIAAATGVLFGLAPASQFSKLDLVLSLKEGAAGHRGSRLQRRLLIAQVALSVVLLVSAGLILRTMRKILTTDAGFDTGRALLMSVDLSLQGYSEAQGRLFFRQLLDRLQSILGVASAALAGSVPPEDWDGSSRMSIFYPGQEPMEQLRHGREFELGLRVGTNSVSPGYFRALGIPLMAGRDFAPGDDENAPGAVIINQELAKRLWPGQHALGKLISCPKWPFDEPAPYYQVIGVTRNARLSLVEETPPLLYFSRLQEYDGRATLMLRTASEPWAVLSAVRGQVATLDRNLPLYAIETMRDHVSGSLWRQKMAMELITIFGVVALLLAAIGLYGVVSHSVAQRTREIGVRMALGSNPGEIVWLVVREGMISAMKGVGAGLLAALACARLISSWLFGVSSADPLSLAAVSLLMAAVTLAASWIPARRAARVDPIVALRYE